MPAATTNLWTVETIKAWAEITINGQVVQFDVSRVVTDFGLNEIPQCTLFLAVGRNAKTLADAPLHSNLNAFTQLLPVQVYGQFTVTAGAPNDVWPAGKILLFDGYTTQAGFRKAFGQVSFIITCSHWLIDLSMSSMLSALSAPTNSSMVSYMATMSSPKSAGAADTGIILEQKTITSTAVSTDLWGAAIKPYLLAIARTDFFNWTRFNSASGFNKTCPGPAPGLSNPNVRAINALNRMEPIGANPPAFLGINVPNYTLGTQLAMNKTLDSFNAALRIAGSLQAENQNLAATTMWDRLIGYYAPSFLFAVVPVISTALVVPFIPGLKPSGTGAERNIFANEIDYYESSSTVPKPLRGVILLVDRNPQAGLTQVNPVRPLIGGQESMQWPGAVYDTCKDGAFICRSAPDWIGASILPNLYTNQSALGTPIPTSQDTQGAAVGAVSAAARALAPAIPKFDTTLFSNFAQALYAMEVLRHRQARVSGKLRLDIAPGTSVIVELPQDRFLKSPVQYLYGNAVRVTIDIDAENQRAGTSLQLAYLRDHAEALDPSLSLTSHPIWSNAWYGAPLSAQIQFP